MKWLLILSFISVGNLAFAKRKVSSMMTPKQQSFITYQALLDYLSKENSMSDFLQIKKILELENGFKIEFLNEKKECVAMSYEISYDRRGLDPQIKPVTNAIVTCQ